MPRPKIDNPKDKVLKVRMDKNLYKQLKRYAKRNDGGLVSVSARKAIDKFLREVKDNS